MGFAATGGTDVEHHGEASDRGPAAWAPGMRCSVSTFSGFSAVDRAEDPGRLIRRLEESAVGLASMKHYMAVAHLAAARRMRPGRAPVLDLGCGAGHDLAVLEALGVDAVGIDPSAIMVDAAASRGTSPVVRAAGERLPFADNAFGGGWIERVLMHVADPAPVVREVVRCVRPGGLLTVFEPDWSSLTVDGKRVPTGWVSAAAHPGIGSTVGDLLASAGCTVLDRVEERSWWTYAELARITNLEVSLERAVARGAASASEVEAWLVSLCRRADSGGVRAEMVKVLWVAATPRVL